MLKYLPFFIATTTDLTTIDEIKTPIGDQALGHDFNIKLNVASGPKPSFDPSKGRPKLKLRNETASNWRPKSTTGKLISFMHWN